MMDAPTDSELRRWASYASLAVAVVLIIAKTSAWFATDSLSLLASLVDALIDVTAALATVFGVRYAARPADAMHRFGHGKAEAMAALIQGLLLAGASCVLVIDGLYRLITPPTVSQLNVGLGVVAGSTVLTALLVLFEGHVTKRSRSHAVAADRTHHLSDIAANVAVLLALALTKLTQWPRFDPLFAIAIAVFFGRSAYVIARTAANTLLDHELSSDDRQRIMQLVTTYPNARGMHDLRTRSSGLVQFIEFHLELDSDLSVQDAHGIANEIESAVKGAFPSSEVIIHMEPAGIKDDRLDDRIGSGAVPPIS